MDSSGFTVGAPPTSGLALRHLGACFPRKPPWGLVSGAQGPRPPQPSLGQTVQLTWALLPRRRCSVTKASLCNKKSRQQLAPISPKSMTVTGTAAFQGTARGLFSPE